MLVVSIGWLYVALMMAVAQATSADGSLTGALITFVFYGAAPVGLLVFLASSRARRRAARSRELRESAHGQTASSSQPDACGEPTTDAIAPVREEH